MIRHAASTYIAARWYRNGGGVLSFGERFGSARNTARLNDARDVMLNFKYPFVPELDLPAHISRDRGAVIFARFLEDVERGRLKLDVPFVGIVAQV